MAVGRGRVVEDVDLRFGGNDFTYKKLFHLFGRRHPPKQSEAKAALSMYSQAKHGPLLIKAGQVGYMRASQLPCRLSLRPHVPLKADRGLCRRDTGMSRTINTPTHALAIS